jgi:hypothetical protein
MFACMRPTVNSSIRFPLIGLDLSTLAGKSRVTALAASECTSALKTLIKCHPYHNETPHYILVMHAIELSLKAFLMKNGVDEKKLKSIGHDLNALYKVAVELGLSLNDPNAYALIAWINEWHQPVKIRYEFTVERELPACSVLVSLADAIIAASE